MKFNKKIKQESLIKKLIQVKRVCKVAEGGTTFSFAALVVVGDGNGYAKIASGKAKEISDAVKKAFEKASTGRFDFFPLKQKRTVHHEVKAKFCASKVLVQPVKKGAGIKVSKMLAPYCEVIGLKEVTIKTFGSRNTANSLKALREALLSIQTERHRNLKRGIISDDFDNDKEQSDFDRTPFVTVDKSKVFVKKNFQNNKKNDGVSGMKNNVSKNNSDSNVKNVSKTIKISDNIK